MPDPAMSSFTTVFRASEPRRVKRNRQTVSCTSCQKRKSRCDRRQPCGSCEKRGDERSCQFVPQNGPTSVGPGNRQEVQSRLHKLEEMVRKLAEGSGSADTRPAPSASVDTAMTSVSSGSQGDAVTTRHAMGEVDEDLNYHGPTSWAALVESIQDIQSALEADGSPTLPGQETVEQSPAQETDVVFGDLAPVAIEDIVKALPSRQEVDKIVSAYFNAKFVAIPFLHMHHFRRRYEAFWQDPSLTGLLWSSILFSVLGAGTMICAVKDAPSIPSASMAEAKSYMNMSARCLVSGQYLLGKALSVEALAMHVHAMFFMEKDANPTVWSLYSLVIRLAQRQGYHRKWEKVSSKLTPFDAEMRRRVWSLIMAYDMVLSLQQGMPPMIPADSYDTELPTNVTDEDFDEDSVQIIARPPNDPLPILAYITKGQLLPILRRIMSHAQGIKPSDWSEVSQLGKELLEWHESIPPCLKYRPIRDSSFTDPNYTVMHRIMLELTYQMSICTLYRSFYSTAMRLGDEAEHKSAIEFCRNAALRVIEMHVEVDREVQPGHRLHADRYMVSSLALHDFLNAAMILCLELVECKDLSAEAKAERMHLLQTAYDMWHARASESLDAVHASKVLRAILQKVNAPKKCPISAPEGVTCPVSAGKESQQTIGPFEGSHFCQNLEQCQQVPVLAQTQVTEQIDFDELPDLDSFFTGDGPTLSWGRFQCPLLFSDIDDPGSKIDFDGLTNH